MFLISVFSCLTGLFLSAAFRKNWVPEFLKPLFTLAAAVCVYAAGNAFQNEGGLVAVTVLGMTLANVPFPSFEEQRRFKEYLTTLLVSFVFIILTATLKPESLLNLPADVILFVCCPKSIQRQHPSEMNFWLFSNGWNVFFPMYI